MPARFSLHRFSKYLLLGLAACSLAQAAPPNNSTNNSTKTAPKTAPKTAKTQPATTAPAPEVPVSSARKAERSYYLAAQTALNKKQFARYQELLPHLKNYPLLPYLEYQELSERLMTLPTKEVEQFFNRYPNSFSAERLRHRWLRALAIKEKWQDYRRFYDSNLTDPELACLQLRARLATGDNSAYQDVAALWNLGKPQVAACDPVFEAWKAAGYLTPALLWSRHLKAVNAGEISLAASLLQEMPAAQQAPALLYENVAQNPRLILQPEHFHTATPETRASIALGLEKYAQTDATAAAELWQTYAKRKDFSATEKAQIVYSIARQLIRQDQAQAAAALVSATPDLSHPELLEALIRAALEQQDWEKAYRWLLRLPQESKQTERWRYWQARIMEQLNIKESEGKSAKQLYAAVAATRSFYGFLASDKLGIGYSLLDKPLVLPKDLMAKIEAEPGIQRAHEFYLLGELSAANREWTFTTNRLSSTEAMVAASRLADRWGWYRQAIQTMQDSEYWDELTIRFPIPYQEHVNAAARQTSLDPHFVFAITKQESAFNIDAKSPVGATGLMQLMPTTAKETAKKAGFVYKPQDLLRADKNIYLGSYYLNGLVNAFSGNRILATAAYNAGPSRVKKWMNKNDIKLPYDVWIETIPYKETRFYVQNVLSFAVIYAYRTGTKQPFITAEEAARDL